MLGKSKIESMCRRAGVLPVERAKVGGTEVFIADGFNADAATFRKFDVSKEDFPFGVFATFWWTFEDEDKFSLGRPLFFDAFHDPGYSPESKQKMRIQSALKDAEEQITRRKGAH
jgi:hypothetical protein